MVSNTGQTRSIRARKHIKAGRKRKNALKNHGTTVTIAELFKVVES